MYLKLLEAKLVNSIINPIRSNKMDIFKVFEVVLMYPFFRFDVLLLYYFFWNGRNFEGYCANVFGWLRHESIINLNNNL